jgi:hypothetical protein
MDLQPVVEAKAQRHPVTSYYEAQMRLEGCHLRISSMYDTCICLEVDPCLTAPN